MIVPIVAATLAAVAIGLSGVAQRHAALVAPRFPAGDPRLLRALAGARWWWIGTAAAAAGIALQTLALATGPLLLVQGVLVGVIVSAAVWERLLMGRRPVVAGVVLTVLGLVGVLTALSPTTGAGDGPSAPVTLAVAGGCAAVMLAIVGWARRSASATSAVAVAACTGLGYGVVAVMLKQVALQFNDGVLAPLGHPALYVAITLGAWSVLLSQNALQRGSGAVAVVTPILVLDPLVGLVAGRLWFGEGIDTSPHALTIAGASLLLLLLGMGLTEAGGRRAAAARPVAAVGGR